MKLKKGIYQNSTGTLTYNPTTGEARSYTWYVLAKRVGFIRVLNTYNYSSTTIKHVASLKSHLRASGFNWIEIESPKGLQDLESSLELYDRRAAKLRAELHKYANNLGSRDKNTRRYRALQETEIKIQMVTKLLDIKERMAV